MEAVVLPKKRNWIATIIKSNFMNRFSKNFRSVWFGNIALWRRKLHNSQESLLKTSQKYCFLLVRHPWMLSSKGNLEKSRRSNIAKSKSNSMITIVSCWRHISQQQEQQFLTVRRAWTLALLQTALPIWRFIKRWIHMRKWKRITKRYISFPRRLDRRLHHSSAQSARLYLKKVKRGANSASLFYCPKRERYL